MSLYNRLIAGLVSRNLGSVSAKPRSQKPAMEMLEERSLLDAAGVVRGMYTTLLQRQAGPSEVNGWVAAINSGMSQIAVAHAIVNSEEHFGLTVRDDYSSLLGRGADAGGLDHWVGAMKSGATDEQVRGAILSSDEYFQKHGADDKNLVDSLYTELLHRNADQGGEAHWLAVLGSTNSRAAVVAGLMENNERHQVEVREGFDDILHREPEAEGEHSWVDKLNQGMHQRDLIEQLAGSKEFGDDHGNDG